MKKEVFIEAVVAGGDLSESDAENLFECVVDKTMTEHLDDLFISISKSEYPVMDTKYCIHQLQSFLNVIKQHHDD